MSVAKASLWRVAALAVIAGAVIATPMGARADALGGLSIRAGAWFPMLDRTKDVTDVAVWGGGIDYKVPWFPRLLNGEAWSSSISADFHYSGRKRGVVRYIPVSINQIYTFEERNGKAPYAGFSATAATFGGSTGNGRQPTVTRFGAGLILGLNWGKNVYTEARYDWIDRHGLYTGPEGIRTYVGYRF